MCRSLSSDRPPEQLLLGGGPARSRDGVSETMTLQAPRRQRPGRNRRARSCGSAEGMKEDRVSAALPFPCRSGKLRERIFSRFDPHHKVSSYQYLVDHFPVEPKARQGNGREAGKPPDRRLASYDQRYHMNKSIDIFTWLRYGAELRFGKRAAGVVRAARGGKDGTSPTSETKRDYEVGRGKPPPLSSAPFIWRTRR